MKKRYIKYWVIYLLIISFLSCSNDNTESVFPDSPAERIVQRNSELLNLLLAESNGFKGIYFTKNNEYGGFTFYMKFNADGTVVMTSDVDSDTDIVTSSYEVRLGSTTELVFTTRGHIQKVSDPDYPGLRGAGFKGTSVFQYFSNENGKITFRDIRNDNEAFFILEPTGFSNFNTESVTKANASLAQRQNLLPTPTKSVFQLLRIENSGGMSNFNLNYDSLRLFASPRITDDNGNVTEFNFGIAFTEDGLTISPSLEFEGETYQDFTYDLATSSYISTVNGTTASILFGNEPAFIDRDFEKLINLGPTGFLYRPRLGSNPLTSLGFDALLEEISTNFAAASLGVWSVRDVQFIIDFESDDCDTYLYIQLLRQADGATFNSFYCFEKGVLGERKLFLTYQGPIAGNSTFFEPLVMPLIDFFNSTKGLIYTDEGSFSTDSGSFSNRAGTFTSLDNPSLRVYGLWFG